MSESHQPKHIPSILIWGGWYGSRNIGDSAILLGLKELIRSANDGKEISIKVLSTDPDYTRTHGVIAEHAVTKSDIFRIRPWFHIFSIFKNSDRVIISGGTPIFDFSHAIRTLYFFLPIIYKKTFTFFGIGVKPINSWYGKRYIPYVLKKSSHISVRDEGSKDVLKGLGLSDEKIHLTADSALFAKPAPQDEVNQILKQYHVNDSESILVVAPRVLSSNKKILYLQEDMGSELIQSTPQKISKAIDSISHRFDKIVFLAMHYSGPDSDIPLIKDILNLCTSNNIVFLNQELRPNIAIGIFKVAKLVLSMRLHALVLSSSVGTPIVGISYEQKVTEFLKRINLKNYCVNLFLFSTDDLITKLNQALDNEESIRMHLKQRIEFLKKSILADAKNTLKI